MLWFILMFIIGQWHGLWLTKKKNCNPQSLILIWQQLSTKAAITQKLWFSLFHRFCSHSIFLNQIFSLCSFQRRKFESMERYTKIEWKKKCARSKLMRNRKKEMKLIMMITFYLSISGFWTFQSNRTTVNTQFCFRFDLICCLMLLIKI